MAFPQISSEWIWIANQVLFLTSRGDTVFIFVGVPGMMSQDKSGVIGAKRLQPVRQLEHHGTGIKLLTTSQRDQYRTAI